MAEITVEELDPGVILECTKPNGERYRYSMPTWPPNERCFDYVDAEDVDNAPTVDAVSVVRCKDCKYSWEDLGGLTCSHGVCVDCIVLGDFYCANGVRKDGPNAEG